MTLYVSKKIYNIIYHAKLSQWVVDDQNVWISKLLHNLPRGIDTSMAGMAIAIPGI